MKKRRLKRCFSKSWRAIQTHAQAYLQTRAGKKLHQMRVDSKQVFAMVHLLRTCGHGGHLKLKALHRLYKKAGQIRGPLVSQKLLQRYRIETEASQPRKHKQLISAFAKHLTGFLRRQQVLHQRLLHRLSCLKTRAVQKEYVRQRQKAAHELARKARPKSWHSARKRVQFLTSLYPFPAGPDRTTVLAPKLKQLKKLQKWLGQWHNIRSVEARLAQAKQGKPWQLRQLRARREALQQAIRAQRGELLN